MEYCSCEKSLLGSEKDFTRRIFGSRWKDFTRWIGSSEEDFTGG